MKRKITVKDISFIGVMIAGAMILSYIESLFSIGIPGLKLGMPNIFIIVILYRFGPVHAASVSFIRAILTALLFGSIMSLWYSLAGAILSLILMTIMKHIDFFSQIGVSIVGGISHNLGQIIVAIIVTGVSQIAYYLPILVIGGTIAGIVVGICATALDKTARKLKI